MVHAEDRFTQYGLIAAAWVNQNCIDHLVMSCRALGLGIEESLLACIASRLAREKATVMLGLLQPTEANTACRQLYSRNGFTQVQNNPVLWSRPLAPPLAPPPHVTLHTPDGETISTGKPTADEQMARYEEHLKENDWGHQPC